MRSGSLRRLGLTAAMLVAAMIGLLAQTVAAQNATPAPVDMGDATTALGIGTETDAFVNVIHASPDAPAVDIWVDGAKAVSGLEFGKATGWVALPAGKHDVVVVPAGGTADQAVINVSVELVAKMGYEVVATGKLAEIKPQIYPVDFSTIASGSARVRVIHTSPDAPAVDVAVKGGDVLISNLAFPDASGYLDVPAGSYDLEVRAAGTTTVALDLPGVTLEAGKIYDVFAIGLIGDKSLTVLPIVSVTDGSMGMATPEASPTAGM